MPPSIRKGLGSILLEHLVEAAEEAGINTFIADVMSSTHEMPGVLRALELPLASSGSGGVVHIEFPTSLTAAAVEAFEQREAVAEPRELPSSSTPRRWQLSDLS